MWPSSGRLCAARMRGSALAGPGPIRNRWGICEEAWTSGSSRGGENSDGGGGGGGGGGPSDERTGGARVAAVSTRRQRRQLRWRETCGLLAPWSWSSLHRPDQQQDGQHGALCPSAQRVGFCSKGHWARWKRIAGLQAALQPTSSTPPGPRCASLRAGVDSPGRALVKADMLRSCCREEAARRADRAMADIERAGSPITKLGRRGGRQCGACLLSSGRPAGLRGCQPQTLIQERGWAVCPVVLLSQTERSSLRSQQAQQEV